MKTPTDWEDEALIKLLIELDNIVFISERDSVTDKMKFLHPKIEDQEAVIVIKGRFDREDLKKVLFSQDFINQAIEEALKSRDKKLIERYQDIFSWLLGENGEFPNLSQKPHYRFRTELRERLKKLQSK